MSVGAPGERPLRIGLDVNPLVNEHRTGIPVYVDSLLREFLRGDAGDEFVLVSRAPAALESRRDSWGDRSRLVSDRFDVRLAPRFPVLARPPLGWVTRKIDGRLAAPINAALARRAIGALDLFHYTDVVARAPVVSAARHVFTIYDLTPRLHPETHRPEMIAAHERLCDLARERADRIITISEASRRDIIEQLGIPEDRVCAIPLAVRASLPRDVSAETLGQVQARLGLAGRPYVLAGGSLEPRKNLPRLIDAFARLAGEPALPEVRLVLAGARWHGANAVEQAVARHRLEERVILTDYIDDETLAALIKGCAAFAYVSIYEGFGLPVLEAMALGAPVVTSNNSSLPEVAGDAALLVDPLSPESIAGALHRLLTEADLARDLRARGARQEQRFSWERTAREHLRLYHEVAGA